MGNGLNGLGRGVAPEVTRPLTPGLAANDAAILYAASQAEETKLGYCPKCGIEATLYGPSADAAADSLKETGMLTSAVRAMQGRHVCTICELKVSPNARSTAIYRGYLWYLIGKPGSEDQEAINRTLWRAARMGHGSYREASRSALRAALAAQPPERGFLLGSTELTGMEKEIATRAVDDVVGVNGRVKNDEKHRRAMMGTVGMHHVLLAAEAGSIHPAWLGNERYFLTGAGMECLARDFPLGRSHMGINGSTSFTVF